MAERILIADDEEHLGYMIKFKLEKSGYEVDWCVNGRDALKAVQDNPPALVILDVMMPGMTGFEVLEAIKTNAALKSIPVIMLTARGQEDDTVRGITLGAADYITKPFRPAELLARVKRLIPGG
ncbi:MAG: response regulator [Deltaproteobacteria bacterium]|nr:response regulator [Deltaproteobacteria bacterium]